MKVHSNGEILSGPEEIASVSRRNELVQLYPKAIAVEMDGDGIPSSELKFAFWIITGLCIDFLKTLIIHKPIYPSNG